jgi:hypothetical protein
MAIGKRRKIGTTEKRRFWGGIYSKIFFEDLVHETPEIASEHGEEKIPTSSLGVWSSRERRTEPFLRDRERVV